MNSYDVAIAYRIYPRVADSARGFPCSDDKLILAELCLKSFRESLANLRVKIWAILDQCPDVYAALFKKYFNPRDLVLVRLENAGNERTFAKQLELLTGQAESDLVYFAEDDYLYLPGQFPSMVDFLRSRDDVDFVSPYDHLDFYNLDLHRQPKWITVHSGHHWRTANSTCLTFLTRLNTLQQTESTFRNYKRRSFDCSLWLSLTKQRVFNPFFFMRHLTQPDRFCRILLKSWLYFWPQILFGKKWNLWVPIPAIATHLDCNALSPNVDWHTLAVQQANHLLACWQEQGTPGRISQAFSLSHGDNR